MTGTWVRTPSLDIEDHDGVTVVRLRHGKVNALDLEVVRAVTAAMRDVGQADHW
jgi:enoyl-CoA hydratase